MHDQETVLLDTCVKLLGTDIGTKFFNKGLEIPSELRLDWFERMLTSIKTKNSEILKPLSVYKIKPVSIREFIENPYYMGPKAPGEPVAVYDKIITELEEINSGKYVEATFTGGIGSGKALWIDTPIPTPNGWIKMGDLQVGDHIYDDNGDITTVLGAFDVMVGHKCYKVSFDDDTSIIADAEHLWLTNTLENRTNGSKPKVKTTEEIKSSVFSGAKAPIRNHSIPVSSVCGRAITTFIDPYTFGAWLGDGSKDGGRFWTADGFIRDEISKYYLVTNGQDHPHLKFQIYGLANALRYWGVLGNKHIPSTWLRASYDQRLALLQGIMDTDGTIDKRQGSCSHVTVIKDLGYQVLELCRSLGLKARLRVISKWCSNSPKGRIECGPFYETYFSPCGLDVFRLPRKKQYIRKNMSRVSPASRRVITSVEEVPSVPVRCIKVDSPTSLFLAGEGFVATHNTTAALYTLAYQLYLLSCMKDPHGSFGLDKSSEILIVFQSLNAGLSKALDYARFKAMVDNCPYFTNHFPYNKAKNVSERLIFPNRIEVVPLSGLETAAIGQNVISGLIDEINYLGVIKNSKKSIDGGTFDQAVALYNSIARRRKSRFQSSGSLPGILCLVSSKRYPGQFTDLKEEESKRDPTIYIYDKRVWDVKPDGSFSGVFFEVFVGDESRKPRILGDGDYIDPKDRHLVDHIPIEFKEDFTKDITNALREIAGKSTLARHPFIMDTEAISRCMNRNDSIFSKDSVDFVIDQLEVYPDNFYKPELPRYAHIDLGITGDSAGLSIGTITGFKKIGRGIEERAEMLPMYHMDGTLEVRPPKGGEILFWKIRDVLYALRDLGLNIKWVSLDTMQSRDTQQILKQKGFFTGTLSMDVSSLPYEITKSALYDSRVSMPYNKRLQRELASLEFDAATGKVDHPKTMGGCFSEDTLVKCVDGDFTFTQLIHDYEIGKSHSGYSYNNDTNSFDIVLLEHPRVTKKVSELIELTFEIDGNITIVRCTPEHLFMLTSGEYKQAELLTELDCLRGLNYEIII